MRKLIYLFYTWLMVPGALLLLQILRPLLSGKLREMIEDKNKSFYRIKKTGSEAELAAARPIWIHAASGEIEYARPVIRELKKIHPNVPIIVTFSSPSAKKILESLHDVDMWAALPWDVDFLIKAFIKRWNPRALLFARTDVWPTLASVAHEQGLPSLLFSATFADNSSRLRGLTRFLTAYSLDQLSEIHCVSDEDRVNLQGLSLKTALSVSGDTRFDQVFHRLENPKELKNSLMPKPEDFVFIAGSTWPEDEAVLIPAFAKLRGKNAKVIIAPHEIGAEHMNKLRADISAAGLKSILYSEAEVWPDGEILIIDRIGILAELYTWADMAFIGGSFKKQVHSVMEALAAGLPVMVGPHHRNNREALFYQKKNYSAGMITQVVHNSNDILVLIERMRKQLMQIPAIKEEIRSEIGRNKNSTQRVLASVEKIL